MEILLYSGTPVFPAGHFLPFLRSLSSEHTLTRPDLFTVSPVSMIIKPEFSLMTSQLWSLFFQQYLFKDSD